VHQLGRRADEAGEAYRLCLEKNPEWTLVLLGQVLEDQERWEEAIGADDELVARDPSYANAYYHRACCLTQLGRDEEAIGDCQRAIDAYAKHHAAYVVMGQILLRQGRLDEAATAVERAMQIKPKDPAVRELARQVLVTLDPARPLVEPNGRKR
jgi:tetratricopeptide (TPR) repeat protein